MIEPALTIELLNMFGGRLPADLGFTLSNDVDIPSDHPLAAEVSAASGLQSASLPYSRRQDDTWVSMAPSADQLRRLIEDLRCWIFPSLGWEAAPSIISSNPTGSRMGELLLLHSPAGYFRWHSRLADRAHVFARLAKMRSVIAQAPVRTTQFRPTVESLRRQFTLGIATGDRAAALQAIGEIDQRQLDTASNVLSMRIRLFAAVGDNQAIVDHPQLDDLLSVRIPQRVADSVLIAHHAVLTADLEVQGEVDAAVRAYEPFHERLSGLGTFPSHGADTAIIRMFAYDAASLGDSSKLHALDKLFPSDAIVATLASKLPLTSSSQLTPSSPNKLATIVDAAPLDMAVNDTEDFATEPQPSLQWTDIPSLIATGAGERLATFLQNAAMTPDVCDPGNGDFVIELFTDSEVLPGSEKGAQVDNVLTTVIDAYVCEDRFPRRERLTLYQAVLEVWLSSRAFSNDPIDGQLMLTIADALLRLDGRLEQFVASAVTRWWETRPVRARLAWLGEALEMLTDQSTAQTYLALWYVGARLVNVDREELSLADRGLWSRLGFRLGLDEETIAETLGTNSGVVAVTDDPLRSGKFRKIAIVTLHERAAREAAAEIESRTKAHVVIVTDHAAGDGTASASTADVILFVWGATKHAVYRAFDKVRDRLEYVQGTGSASIVRALERRARVSE
ncbi:hypothetical protein [Rhizobium sp. CRRU65]|uniref:hypothetical protein n=1 Tax=Rhizobium sp. CRRU65 TaxID=3399566 RepID=UPI003AF55FD7